MDTINVYARAAEVNGEGDQVSVFLKNVDVSQVVKEFNAIAVLESLEWSDIISYVNEQKAEEDDE